MYNIQANRELTGSLSDSKICNLRFELFSAGSGERSDDGARFSDGCEMTRF